MFATCYADSRGVQMNWPKGHKLVSDFMAEIIEGETKRIIVMEAKIPPEHRGAYHGLATSKDGRTAHIIVDGQLPEDRKKELVARELAHLKGGGRSFDADWVQDINQLIEQSKKHATLALQSVIIPERKVTEGILVKSISVLWARMVEELSLDWTKAYQIPPHIWEEIIAGAFKKAGFEEVILTPRSRDHGRDVLATSRGVGCVKIIGSVKAYAPNHLVKHDHVRALLGVLSGEQNASKGIVATTSDFAPLLASDPYIKPFLPTRLELLNGEQLKDWLLTLSKKT